MGSCLFLRKGDVHTAPGALPLGYSALEYIQSTGAQYIDTGFKHNQNTRVVIKAQVTTQPSSHAWLFEGRESGVSHKSLILLSGKTWNTDYKNGVMDGHRIAYSSVGVTDLLNIDYNKNVVNINGNTHTYEVESFQSNYNLTLFAANTAGNVAGFISAKMWYCQIYDNGVLVRDFIPCKNAEGVVGLYDLVNKKFYGSASTTAFIESPSGDLPAIGTALNDMTWEQVRAISDAGKANSYFAVGDIKSVDLIGTLPCGDEYIDITVDVFILGIGHNAELEGASRIHFGIGKMNGTDIALVDSMYGQTTGIIGQFTMNTTSSNTGGWESSHMRKTVLGSDSMPTSPTANTLLAALPADLRAVMKAVTKYSYNSSVSATVDYLPLLAEFEVQGSRTHANSAEQNYQKQYDYYKAGNSSVKYRHSATTSTVYWWTRSTYFGNSTSQCFFDNTGASNIMTANYSYGISPAFAV